jgi:hypothetical protein
MQFRRRRLLARRGDIKGHCRDHLVETGQSDDHHETRGKRHVISRRMMKYHPT